MTSVNRDSFIVRKPMVHLFTLSKSHQTHQHPMSIFNLSNKLLFGNMHRDKRKHIHFRLTCAGVLARPRPLYFLVMYAMYGSLQLNIASLHCFMTKGSNLLSKIYCDQCWSGQWPCVRLQEHCRVAKLPTNLNE